MKLYEDAKGRYYAKEHIWGDARTANVYYSQMQIETMSLRQEFTFVKYVEPEEVVQVKAIEKRVKDLEQVMTKKALIWVHECNGLYWQGADNKLLGTKKEYLTSEQVEALKETYEVGIVSFTDEWRNGKSSTWRGGE